MSRRRIVGFVAPLTLLLLAVRMSCDGDTSDAAANPDMATIEMFPISYQETGETNWRIEILGADMRNPEATDYRIVVRDADGNVVSEDVMAWHELLPETPPPAVGATTEEIIRELSNVLTERAKDLIGDLETPLGQLDGGFPGKEHEMGYTMKALMAVVLVRSLWLWYRKRTPWVVTALESKWEGRTNIIRNMCYGILTLLLLALLVTACGEGSSMSSTHA